MYDDEEEEAKIHIQDLVVIEDRASLGLKPTDEGKTRLIIPRYSRICNALWVRH